MSGYSGWSGASQSYGTYLTDTQSAQSDLVYFREKMRRAGSPEAAEKYRKQLELLEDAVVIYQEGRLPDPYHLPTARQYTLPSFPLEHARVRDFLKKVLDI